MIQKYEQVLSGSANRILKMAENQSTHRQKIENKVIDSNIANEKTGMFLSFVITAILIIGGGVLILLDKQIAGYLALFGTSGFQAANYTFRKYMEKERIRKKEMEIEKAKKGRKRAQ